MEDILHALHCSNTIVLTPTKNLANFLIQKFNNYNKNKKSWDSANIYSYYDWIEKIYQEASFRLEYNAPRFLNLIEQTVFIFTILENELNSTNLPTIENMVKNFVLLKQHKISPKELQSYHLSNEQMKFLTLFDKYETFCANKNVCDIGNIVDLIIDNNLLNNFICKKIILLNFIEINPQFERLIKYLKSLKINLVEKKICNFKNAKYKISCKDVNEEIYSAAVYARDKCYDSKIAIVVPQLEQHKQLIYSTFYNALKGDDSFTLHKSNNIENYALIKASLLILELMQDTITVNILMQIMYSPFIGTCDESIARQSLSVKLLNECDVKMTWNRVLGLLKKNQEIIPDLYFRLNDFVNHYEKIKNEYCTPLKWSKEFDTMLSILGFPGDKNLNCIENKLYDSWFYVLKLYSGLNFCTPKHNLCNAIFYVNYIAQQKKYTDKIDKPIVIAEPHDLLGIEFDYIWFLKMNKNIWPGECFMNPYLPVELQKKYHIPGISPNVEFVKASILTNNIKSQAKNEIIFSYSLYFEQSKSFASSLLDNFDNYNMNFFEKKYFAADFEEYDDHKAPPLMKNYISSGVKFIELQITCPFKAFAELRLNVKPIFEKKIGFDAAERGQMTHMVLHKALLKIKNKKKLMQFSKQELYELLLKIVSENLKLFWKKKSYIMPKYVLHIEQDRLAKLILKWLELEKQRENFEVVSLEVEKKVQISDVKFNVKIDRLDKTEEGTIVIDYKTGSCSTNGWFDAVESPQLPVYAIVMNADAISFGCLKKQQFGFKGVTRNKDIIKLQVVNDWEQQLLFWKNKIKKIVLEYKKGVAEAKPINGKKTCDQCELHTLCRINV